MGFLLGLISPVLGLVKSFFDNKAATNAAEIVLEQTTVLSDASVTKTALETQPVLITAEQGVNNSFLARNIRYIVIAVLFTYIAGRLFGLIDAHTPPEFELYCVQGTFGLLGVLFSLRTVEKWRGMKQSQSARSNRESN